MVDGRVSTVAGRAPPHSLAGFRDGDAITEALLNYPTALALDPTRRLLYFSDRGNNAIRCLDLGASTVSTLAGHPRGLAGWRDGAGSDALFSGPMGLAWDPHGNQLFISDTGNNRLRLLVLPADKKNSRGDTAR